MGTKRSSKRNRRDPVRHPVPPPTAEARARAAARAGPSAHTPRLPEYTSAIFSGLLEMPIDAVPLYAMLAVVHQDMSGRSANTCISVCRQIAASLQLLGFDAESMVAYTTIEPQGHQAAPQTEIGVRDQPPIVRPDGTTDGHMVVWADSFNRLVDPTIMQEPRLRRAARTSHTYGLPVVLPVAGGRAALERGRFGTHREPYLTWTVFPQWTYRLDFAPTTEYRDVFRYGALGLAGATLEILRGLSEHRDLTELHRLYPQLHELLVGRRELPALPADPPASWTAMRTSDAYFKLQPTEDA